MFGKQNLEWLRHVQKIPEKYDTQAYLLVDSCYVLAWSYFINADINKDHLKENQKKWSFQMHHKKRRHEGFNLQPCASTREKDVHCQDLMTSKEFSL